MDRYEYPTEEQLETIRTWDWGDFKNFDARVARLWDYIKDLWWNVDWGWTITTVTPEDESILTSQIGWTRRLVSTGGWSGNESIIDALMDNGMFWQLCWVSSRRGGHYEFRDPKLT